MEYVFDKRVDKSAKENRTITTQDKTRDPLEHALFYTWVALITKGNEWEIPIVSMYVFVEIHLL